MGNPVELSPSQLEIFDAIVGRLYPRIFAATYTQFGKSFTTGLAVLTRVTHFPEKWTIIAPKDDQAKIIMGYIIDHIFDNELTTKKFEMERAETVDRIRRERSRKSLTFRLADGGIGGVQVLSAQGNRRKNILDAIMGFGSKNIILDESSILPDENFSGVMRMLGGYEDNFLMQIGNPFYRNHFHKASKNPRYHKIIVDWRRGVAEGRMTRDFIEEMREEMRPEIFRVLYDVKFPEEDAVDKDGYSALFTSKTLENAQIDEVEIVGRKRAFLDVAGGGKNQTVLVIRGRNAARVALRTNNGDHMVVGPKVIEILRREKIRPQDVGIDGVGVGHGFMNFLRQELGSEVRNIKNGAKPPANKKYAGMEFENLRAYSYWEASEWVNHGGKLERDRGFDELEDIRYTESSGKKIVVKGKDEMRNQGISSPDTADAFAGTFAWVEELETKPYTPKPYVGRSPYEGGDRDNRGPGVEGSKREGAFDRYGNL